MNRGALSASNPFPGLRSFDYSDAELFYGREAAIDQVLDRLAKNRLLAVMGPSGIGKSSLIRAGVIPEIITGGLGGGFSQWQFAICHPGVDPIANLAHSLDQAGLKNADDELRISSHGLVDLIRRSGDPATGYLVVVDQFEEIFRFQQYARNEDHEFFAALLAVAARSDVPLYVVLTMRADFFGDLSHLPRLPEALSNGVCLIPRMTRFEMREAIEEPIAHRGAEIDQACVHNMLNDVEGTTDALVRLQHALRRTWDASRSTSWDRPISRADYEAIGGIPGALDQHAEQVFFALAPSRQETAKRAFQALAEERDGRIFRHPTRLGELSAVAEESTQHVAEALEPFRNEQFLFWNVDSSDDAVVDLSHEALLRSWTRLQDWTKEEARSRETYLDLAHRARYEAENRGGLLIGLDLEQTVRWWDHSRPNAAWSARYGVDFSAVSRFIDLSRRQSSQSQRRSAVVGGMMGIVLVLLLVALSLYVWRQF